MPTTIPIDFEERAKRPPGATNADYPYAIKARDLMEDFVYAALDVDDSLVEQKTGQGGHKQRRLKIPALPTDSEPKSLQTQGGQLSWGEGGGVTREYYVTINGELFLEGFKCATQNESGQSYPIEV
jgi:hypothetical protein